MDDGNMLKLEVLNLNLDTFRYTKRRGVAGANPELKKNTFTLISPKNRPGVERLALVTPASFLPPAVELSYSAKILRYFSGSSFDKFWRYLLVDSSSLLPSDPLLAVKIARRPRLHFGQWA